MNKHQLAKLNAYKISDSKWASLLVKFGDLSYCGSCGSVFHMDDLKAYSTNKIGDVLCSKCERI